MTNPQLTRPVAVDIVPASEVGDLIEATDRDFVTLEQEATRATAAAREAEARALDAGVDPKSSAWTMVRLQRFLDTLRAEAQRDAEATIAVAHQRARIRVEDARAGSLRPGQPAPDSFAPTTGWQVESPPPAHRDTVAPVAAVVPPPAAVVPLPTDVAPTPAPPTVSTNGHVPVATVLAPVTQAPIAQVVEPPTVQVPPVVIPPIAAAPVAQVAPPPMAPQQHVAPAPPVQPVAAPVSARKKKGVLRRLPIAAILEVIAVLLVLVFILLRLS